MFRMKFSRMLLGLGTIFVFCVIYQHNLIIKLSYARQRLEIKKRKLLKEKNELTKELYQLKDLTKTRAWAIEQQGMKDLALSHIMTLTTKAQYDFFVTSTMMRK